MNWTNDRWIQLPELAKLFGLSEESMKRVAKNHGFPLRRLTPYATPGVLESELFRWLKAQPMVGRPIRAKGVKKQRRSR
jgi:predicted DNA-binding transcriptional regulator AlpA